MTDSDSTDIPTPDNSSEPTGQGRILRLVDAALNMQVPAATAYVDGLRAKNPDASPADLLKKLNRRFLAATSASGASVGAAAAAPGVGTGVSLALSAGESVVSLEATVFYVFAVGALHGVSVREIERRRTLLFAILLGNSADRVVHDVAGRTGKHWAKAAIDAIPMEGIRRINGVLGHNFVTKYGTRQGVLVLGRAIPFGLGAAIGGGMNYAIGQAVVKSTRRVFGPTPESFEES
ncbi:hypothetical protein GCM10009784_26870 [Arthrobacter parietis]|uniref:EcsC family protein n=1 Tax=Arthrobacter parietis TaxID=271434 RepID=A0ABP5MU47_9MICC